MRSEQINRISSRLLLFFSMVALLTVLSGLLQPPHPPEPDEGTAAHIFQLSVAAFALASLLFLATANWQQPLQSTRPLAIPMGAVGLAFAVLYYLEHVRWK